jgi:tetratricopeptide (TPR) repeat protein
MIAPTPAGPAGSGGREEGFAGRLTELARGYQRVLAADPAHPQALMGMSLVALASGQHEAAVEMARAAVAAAPGHCVAWVTLGQALKAAGRCDEAECAYGRAIQLDGTNALARMGLGELKLAAGQADDAVREYELALHRQPGLAPAHLGLGNALACLGRNEDALARYEHCLALKPRLPEAEFAAGYVLARLGRQDEAITRYRRALAARPDFAAAWLNLGDALRERGREMHAEAALLRAVELRPDLIAGWLNLALLERERRRPEKAEAHLKRALEIDPDCVETHIAWCQLRVADGDAAGAWQWAGRALEQNPRHAEAVNMRGILLHNEGRFEQAVEAFAQAEALGSHAAVSNRGNSLLDMGRDAEALRAHEAAVERDPHSPGALYNLALTRLRLGDWERGWPDYEARWRFREVHRNPRVFRQPRWRGEVLSGSRILLHAEQGLGDTIQFCRYAELVAVRGGHVIIQVQRAAARLMQSLAVVRSGLAEVAILGQAPPGFELECPLMSLPAVFGTSVETVPWAGAYLGAEPELVEQKRAGFPSRHPGLRVGLAWAGNPRYKADRQRSTDLDTLLPLLRAEGVNWISLQKREAARQIDSLPAGVELADGCSRDCDLADAAALMATLDLVITTDTSIAHLAGAMGMPVWILLPHLPDWRWMQRAETTPWYPTARLFRQREAGDWGGVVARVIVELSDLKAIA